jgi:hypothetical protein
MENTNSQTNGNIEELLSIAHKIESLTSPSKDSDDFD